MTDETDPRVEIVNRLERAAMAYERLGKLTRDDEKTREMRKATIAELADARRAILAALDAARPVEPQLTPETAPTMADMQRMTDDLLTDPAAMDAYMDANPLPVEPPVDEEVAALAEALDYSDAQVDRARVKNNRLRAEIADLRAKLAMAVEATMDVTASLVAAHSLLSRGGKKAAPSDKMFEQMLKDYQNSVDRARAALASIKEPRT